MRKNYLNELYSEYAKGKLGRVEFVALIYQYLFNNQKKTNLFYWARHDYEDYVSWLFPRLNRIVDAYREENTPFEVFFGKAIIITGKEYHVRTVTRGVTEYSAWSVQIPDLYAHEEAPAYLYEKSDNKKTEIIADENGRTNTRQLLALILKCYYFVSDDLIERIAAQTEIDKEELKEMIDRLKKKRQIRDDYLYNIKERIYSQYYRCIVYEKRLTFAPANSIIYDQLKRRLEKARNRLKKMRKRASKIRTIATNREVAEVIGISKGAVDASLHNLKIKWGITIDKSMLN